MVDAITAAREELQTGWTIRPERLRLVN